ncbi:MAG: 6-phosphogluconolactonase [Planctomycetota bacterium]
MAAALKTFSVDSLPVRVFPTTRELALHAAREAREILRAAIAARGAAAAILASGNSQLQFLEELVAPAGQELDWSRVTLLHMDEYLGISNDHPASIRRYSAEVPLGRGRRPGTARRMRPLHRPAQGPAH